MTNKPLPVLLVIAAIIVPIAVPIIESAIPDRWSSEWWVGWCSQIVPNIIRESLLWMIACFITMRHGATNWTTRTVPIALGFLIVACHVIASAFALNSGQLASSSDGWGIIAHSAAAEITSLVLVSANLLTFSQLLNVSLIPVNFTLGTPPQRITVRTILITTTCIAIFLALQNWIRSLQVNLVSPNQASSLIVYLIYFVCNASAFFGLIWLCLSTKGRWLGLAGVIIWPLSPWGQIFVVFSSELEKTMPGFAMSIIPFILTSLVTALAGILMTIPIFRLFGYQFRINDQQSFDVLTSDSPQHQLGSTLAVNSPLA